MESNYIHYDMREFITDLSTSSDGAAVDVW